MARKTKLDERIKKVITEYVGKGNYIKHACLAAGVSVRVYYNWIERGENPRGPEDEIYVQFMQEIKKAEAECIAKNIDIIEKAAERPNNWTAAAWWLERRFPSDFGKRIELELGPSKVLIALQDRMAALRGVKEIETDND